MDESRTITKRILDISLPLAFSQIVRLSSMFIATIFIARLGSLQLAALGLGVAYSIPLLLFSLGTMSSVMMVIGRYLGEKNIVRVRNMLGQSLWLAFIVSAVFMFFLYISPWLFARFGQDPKVVVLAGKYCRGYMWTPPTVLFSLALQQLLTTLGRVKIVNMLSVLWLLINTLFVYVFVMGHWGFAQHGVAGAGYAFSLTSAIILILTSLYFYTQSDLAEYRFHREVFPASYDAIKQFLNLGVPVGVAMILENGMMFMLSIMLGIIDRYSLAAYQVVIQLAFLSFMIPVGVAQASTIITSMGLGANDHHAIKQSFIITSSIIFVSMLFFSILFILIPHSLLSIILHSSTGHEKVIFHYAVPMLIIVGLYQVVEGLRLNCLGVLRGFNDVKAPLYISIVASWIFGVAVAYLFGFVFHWGVIGVWSSLLVAIAVGTLLVGLRLKQQWHRRLL